MSDIESDHLPQHDPPEDAELVQPEVDERHDSIVLEGDDPDHVFPPTELDPYTPEPNAAAAGRKPAAALWIGLLVLVAIVVFAIVLAVR
jgi:hypothetical protein